MKKVLFALCLVQCANVFAQKSLTARLRETAFLAASEFADTLGIETRKDTTSSTEYSYLGESAVDLDSQLLDHAVWGKALFTRGTLTGDLIALTQYQYRRLVYTLTASKAPEENCVLVTLRRHVDGYPDRLSLLYKGKRCYGKLRK